MAGQLYRTFVAINMKVEELIEFLSYFSELECTSWTKTCITWGETSPRVCTISIHVEEEQSSLLLASFEDGLLHFKGWDKHFTLLEGTTTVEEIGSEFIQPKITSDNW